VIDRRTVLAEAALSVVAEHGLRGLTHRAVDTCAGLPQGTTSNYYRTRATLVGAVVDRLEQLDRDVWASLAGDREPDSPADLADGLADLVVVLSVRHAAPTRARLALSLDHPDVVAGAHARLLATLRQALEALGVSDPWTFAQDLADHLDGVLLHTLTVRRSDGIDRDALAASLRRLLGAA
jgi:DNA-binding transcriptional regulator YbjK